MIDLFNPTLPKQITVKVTPKAASNRIKIDHKADGTFLVRVYVTVVAEDGKANEAVIALLAKELKIPKSAMTILQGFKTPHKVLGINHSLITS